MCVCVCVCQASAERIKETDGQNLSNVVSDFIHSRWREEERGGRGGRKTTHGRGKVGTNPPSHGQTRPGLHPSPFNANQSQGCQLRSTCTPPARKPLPDKSPLITRLCGGAATDAIAVLSSVLMRWERLVYVLKSSCDTEPKPQKFNQPLA